jgi:hypothetical protein
LKKIATFFLVILAQIICVASSGRAQQTEQVETVMQYYLTCSGYAAGQTGNQLIYPENYVDQLLPNPLYVTKVFLWTEMGASGLLPATITGNVSLGIDPGKRYARLSGFPVIQNSSAQYLKTLGAMELFPRGSIQSWKDFDPPLSYHAGTDAIILAPECNGGPTINFYVALYFISTGDLSTLPMPIVTYDAPADSITLNNAPISIRNIIPAQTGSKIRVHANAGPQQNAPGSFSSASHVSVCIQSGSGPNCIASPVELKFLGVSGYFLGPGMVLWSDWTPFPVTSGQNLLVITSFTDTANKNDFGYKATSAFGNWSSSVDGWNQAVIPGTPSFQANRTHAIDGVQQQ